MSVKLSLEEKEALWNRVSQKLPTPQSKASRPYQRSYLVAAAAALLVVGGSYAKWHRQAAPEGPLAYADGVSYPGLELLPAGGDAHFADQSTVHAEIGARVELLDNAALRFALKQPKGVAHYAVTPGGTRRWTVDTPLATVEVVGTAFEVNSSAERVSVHVAHGVVIVRGDRVPGHAVRLTDGQSLTVVSQSLAPSPAAVVAQEPPTTPSPSETPRHAAPAPAAESAESARVSELMGFADSLRAEGRQEAAAAALRQIVSKHDHDPRAALAAFTLGRIYMDVLDKPDEAHWSFGRALALGLAPALRPDAEQRLAAAQALMHARATTPAAEDTHAP